LARIAAYEDARLQRLTESQVKKVLIEEKSSAYSVFALKPFLRMNYEDQIACLRFQIRKPYQGGFGIEMGIDELEEMVDGLNQADQRNPFAASGPHPVAHGLAWSAFERSAIFGPNDRAFSIHRTEDPPWEPHGPWIEEPDYDILRRRIRPPYTAKLSNRWTFRVRFRDVSELKTAVPQKGSVWFDAANLEHVGLALPEAGGQIAPLGMNGKHKSIGNLFTDHKIPVSLRPKWPLVVDKNTGEVLWVTWLAQSELHKVTPETKVVLECTWRTKAGFEDTWNYEQWCGAEKGEEILV
jgi:tRNA(Ile)-lysidine synthetase-like protein